MRIGVTGHQRLAMRLNAQGASHSEAVAWEWVDHAFADFLEDLPAHDAVVMSSLAGGADQQLARVALEQGAKIEAIIPSANYIETFVSKAERNAFEQLLGLASATVQLGFSMPTELAFLSAGHYVVDHSEAIVAVWDGEAADGIGGTADIVHYSLQKERPTLQLNPILREVRWMLQGE